MRAEVERESERREESLQAKQRTQENVRVRAKAVAAAVEAAQAGSCHRTIGVPQYTVHCEACEHGGILWREECPEFGDIFHEQRRGVMQERHHLGPINKSIHDSSK